MCRKLFLFNSFVVVFVVAFAFSTTAMAADIAISTQAGWFGQAAADREMQEIVDNVTAVSVEQFTADQQDALADWVVAHTGDGVSDLLILCGNFPDTIYPPGNAQPDGSLAELFLDDGNTIVNTGDYLFYVNSGGTNNNGEGGIREMMDIAGITMWDDNTPAVVTAEGNAVAPSLQDFQTDRPFHLDELEGDWYVELVLAQNDTGTRADPVIVANSATGGRLGIFYQTSGQDDDPRGEVISEWINNWFLTGGEIPNSPAWRPNPEDGAIDVDATTLEWNAGYGAVSHMIYLSTDETIDESDLIGETELTLIAADLAPATTYYWRVDEVEAEIPADWDSLEIDVVGAVVNEGDVWSFMTMTIEAHDQSPSDGAESVSIDTKLSWTAGKDAIMHDVYFGTDKEAVGAADPSTFMGKIMETSFSPGPLEKGTTYYWKVDEFAVVATNPGPLWSFATEVPSASDPDPQDGGEDTVQSPVLSFSPDMKAVEHDLYLGDDADAVADADVNTPDIYLGRQAETSLDAGELEWGKTYYWRVDEVDEADAGSPWKGTVWSFTTSDYLIIDLSETVLDYDNSAEPFTTEASWDTPADLTVNGVTDLQFRFQGAPGPEGSASLDEETGTYTITGSGADVWGSSDQFHYMYRELSGDGSIIAQVVDNGTGSNNWAKGGVMIRETLDADSKHTIMALTGSSGGGITFQGRPVTGERSNSMHDDITAEPPHWVKLTREGNTITAYHSADGVTWELFTDTATDGDITNPWDVEMADPVLIGLFVTSHAAGEVRTYTFDSVSTTGKISATAANQDVGITSNSAEKLYLAVVDSAGGLGVVTHVDPAATQIDQWWTMKVPLLAFSDAGVDVADANKLYIGVGDVDNPTAGDSGTIRIDSIKVVKPISILEPTDVTAPGDNVRGVPNDGDWPGAETPPLAVDDDSETKYLHFKGDDVIDPNADPTGFKVTPLAGATIVTGLTFTTANDVPGRDPVAFELYGSNVGIDGPYNLIASGDIVDFNDEVAWPRFKINATPITFENATVYKHYQVLFPAIRGPVGGSVNSMQIAEVELIGVTGDVLVDITAPGNTIYGYPTDGDWSSSENPLKALDNDIETNYRHKKGEKQPTGFVVTPSKKKVVNRLSITTADDAPERDPVAFKFYGSNDDVYSGPWTLIASGKIDDFNQEAPWPRLAKNETPIVFDNDVAYKHYRLMITDVRDAGSADSMQLAEVELIEALD